MAVTDYRPTPQFWYALAGACAVLVVVIFILKPAFTGYGVYRAMQDSGMPDTYISDMQKLKSDMTSAQMDAKAAKEAQANDDAKLSQAVNDRATAQSSLADCRKQLDDSTTSAASAKKQQDALVQSLGTDVSKAKDDLAACQKDAQSVADAQAVIFDAARRLCCIQRVDNAAIDSYKLDGGKIVCATGAELNLTC